MSVEIVKVKTNKQLKTFIRFNYELYKENPYEQEKHHVNIQFL